MLSHNSTTDSLLNAANTHIASTHGESVSEFVKTVTRLVEGLFAGEHPNYRKIDLRYHNFEHTVLATQCYIDLAAGRVLHRADPFFTHRQFSLGFAAILLHDCGYLKTRTDLAGSGAKYTNTHVERSCAMASAFLPELGCTSAEVTAITQAIQCTGVNSRIDLIQFPNEAERVLGCMVATADYLGQMADPNYPAKLSCLFAEFEESNDFNGVPFKERLFRTERDLIEKTPQFWTHFTLPKLEADYQAVYRYLAANDGQNPYVLAVEQNLAAIAAQLRK
jgi:hypothetical protein